jgi:hypothetical protein
MMLIREFELGVRRYRRAGLMRMAFGTALVLAYVVLVAKLSQPLFGARAPEGPFVPLCIAGALLVVLWLVGTSKAWNRRWGVNCPECERSVVGSHAILISGYCPYCNEKIIEEIPDDSVSRLMRGSLLGVDREDLLRRLTQHASYGEELRERAGHSSEAAGNLHAMLVEDLTAVNWRIQAVCKEPTFLVRKRRELVNMLWEGKRRLEGELSDLEARWPMLGRPS